MSVTLGDIKRVNRFNEPGEEGGEMLMAQMLVWWRRARACFVLGKGRTEGGGERKGKMT
jgi:hypothetical protein